MTNTQKLTEALACVKRGWPVFPLHNIRDGFCSCGDTKCDPNNWGKHPKTINGLLNASPNPGDIRQWWGRWPDANIGIVTGRISGLVVIDIDPRHGGDESLKQMESEHEPLPHTIETITGGRGRHLYFAYPDEVERIGSTTNLGGYTGVDIRGDGGYVVGASSDHASGHNYEWELSSSFEDCKTVPFPAWLLKLNTNGSGTANPPGWETELFTGVTEPGRDMACIRLVGYLKAKGISADTTTTMMKLWASTCTPPFSEKEVEKCVKSSYRNPLTPPTLEPAIQYNGGVYKIIYAELDLQIQVDRIRERQGVMYGEMTAQTGKGNILYPTQVNLLSHQSRAAVAKAIDAKMKTEIGTEIVNSSCGKILELYREGEPVKTIGSLPPRERPKYRLFPLVLDKEANLIFGAGGAGKSYIACMIAVLVQTGESRLSLKPVKGNVLYLDNETCEEEIDERIKAIAKGWSIESPFNIHYRYCTRPIASDIEAIQKAVMDNNIELVIIDSVGKGCGGEPESADVVLRYFEALRSLKCTTISIDHVTKIGLSKTAFGSVYKMNSSRCAFEVKKADEPDENSISVGLYHRKINTGRLAKPFGYTMHFFEDGAATMIEAADIRDIPEFSDTLPLQDQIEMVLKYGGKTVKDIASGLDKPENSIRTVLNRFKGRKFTVLLNGQWGNASHEQE